MAGPGAGRAGRYIRQVEGYRAFIPAPLPPDPPPALSGRLRVLLSQADRALGRLDGSVVTLPSPDHLVFMFVRKEAVLSSQIEGTQSSLQDVLAAEADLFDAVEIPKDVDEVLNYVSAMNLGLSRLVELPVSVRLIREIHERLLHGVRGQHHAPGELRSSQNWIGPRGATIAEATFVPPPHHDVAGALGNLERFLHDRDDDIPLLVKIGLAHAQFETIHPFLDGNGRVGRLLISFLLTERAVLSRPVLYLSYYLKKHQDEYYRRLQSVRDDGDWEAWLEFFLTGVIEVSDESADVARRVLVMREQHRTLIADRLGRIAGNGHRVLERLASRPIMSVRDVQEITGSSYAPANVLVSNLVDLGILKEITGFARNRKFRYEPYVRLFSETSEVDE